MSGLSGDPRIYYTTDNSPDYSAHNYADVHQDEKTLRNRKVEEFPENQIIEKQAGAAASNLPVMKVYSDRFLNFGVPFCLLFKTDKVALNNFVKECSCRMIEKSGCIENCIYTELIGWHCLGAES